MKQNAIRLKNATGELDSQIESFIKLNNEAKAFSARAAKLKAAIEARYTLNADQEEMLSGNDFYAKKVPVLVNRVWMLDELRAALATAGLKPRQISAIISRVVSFNVDEKALKQLIKDNVVGKDIFNLQTGDRTFKSMFGRIEDLVAAQREAEEKEIKAAEKAEEKKRKEAEKLAKRAEKATAKAAREAAKAEAAQRKADEAANAAAQLTAQA